MNADHARYDELAVGWALHALEPEDESSFTAHLSGCERCARTVAETEEVMGAMATDLPQPEPSEGLRHRIRAAVEQTEQVPEPAAPSVAPVVRPIAIAPEPRREVDHRSRWRRALPAGLVAAGIAAILAMGLWNVVLTSDRQELQATVAEQSAVMNGLLAPGQATIAPLEHDGLSVATVVARGDEVQVLTHGLSVNDADSTSYVLWGMGGQTAQPLGTFDVTSAQMALTTVGSGLTGFDQFATYGISLEPGQEAPSLPTEVVATGQVTS
ncbi:anti-sigma factor [Blastococcus sp. CT_GayMR16]|uniref:anti-sigma factor n=1 Tax=Blastococcus sp. CT_GayMR16 TaxID=2559607 RepID=UPI0010737FD1|nr:anti-sigma factor [Blastococcus sp. CT_GayMR16]TFV87602.1 anti-sigma factor [Blastococcus sp. CT_GayMR16]